MSDKTVLPPLPVPDIYAHELIQNGGGVWLGVHEKGICEQAYTEGETGDEVRQYFTPDQMYEYARAVLAASEDRRDAHNDGFEVIGKIVFDTNFGWHARVSKDWETLGNGTVIYAAIAAAGNHKVEG